MGGLWGGVEVSTLTMPLCMLVMPLSLYLQNADVVRSEALALSRDWAENRRKRFRKLQLRLLACLVSALCSCFVGVMAMYLGSSFSHYEQGTGLRLVSYATMIAGALCAIENLLFACFIGSLCFIRLRDLRRPAE